MLQPVFSGHFVIEKGKKSNQTNALKILQGLTKQRVTLASDTDKDVFILKAQESGFSSSTQQNEFDVNASIALNNAGIIHRAFHFDGIYQGKSQALERFLKERKESSPEVQAVKFLEEKNLRLNEKNSGLTQENKELMQKNKVLTREKSELEDRLAKNPFKRCFGL